MHNRKEDWLPRCTTDTSTKPLCLLTYLLTCGWNSTTLIKKGSILDFAGFLNASLRFDNRDCCNVCRLCFWGLRYIAKKHRSNIMLIARIIICFSWEKPRMSTVDKIFGSSCNYIVFVLTRRAFSAYYTAKFRHKKGLELFVS